MVVVVVPGTTTAPVAKIALTVDSKLSKRLPVIIRCIATYSKREKRKEGDSKKASRREAACLFSCRHLKEGNERDNQVSLMRKSERLDYVKSVSNL
jgi:hypothetical protein